MPRILSRLGMLIVAAATLTYMQIATAQTAKPSEDDTRLFAVEITIGPNWNAEKAPQEQLHFSEHSANLKRLRDAGALIMGARYADKGLILLAAADESDVSVMMEQDPSMKAGVFQYSVSPFRVFYGGTVNSRASRTAQ